MIFKIVEIFNYRERQCVIVEVDLGTEYLPVSHNGYIRLNDDENDLNIECICDEEITFEDTLKYDEIKDNRTYIGFDTNHANNTKETKTAKYVKMKIKEIVDELDNKVI